jgi:hypothetical protein
VAADTAKVVDKVVIFAIKLIVWQAAANSLLCLDDTCLFHQPDDRTEALKGVSRTFVLSAHSFG